MDGQDVQDQERQNPRTVPRKIPVHPDHPCKKPVAPASNPDNGDLTSMNRMFRIKKGQTPASSPEKFLSILTIPVKPRNPFSSLHFAFLRSAPSFLRTALPFPPIHLSFLRSIHTFLRTNLPIHPPKPPFTPPPLSFLRAYHAFVRIEPSFTTIDPPPFEIERMNRNGEAKTPHPTVRSGLRGRLQNGRSESVFIANQSGRLPTRYSVSRN